MQHSNSINRWLVQGHAHTSPGVSKLRRVLVSHAASEMVLMGDVPTEIQNSRAAGQPTWSPGRMYRGGWHHQASPLVSIIAPRQFRAHVPISVAWCGGARGVDSNRTRDKPGFWLTAPAVWPVCVPLWPMARPRRCMPGGEDACLWRVALRVHKGSVG